jgi:hypothetical protein
MNDPRRANTANTDKTGRPARLSRRAILAGAGAIAAGAIVLARRRVIDALAVRTPLSSFRATPAPPVYDKLRDRSTLWIAQGLSPAANIDAVLEKANIASLIPPSAIVLIKVSAQWWNQGMTNVAAVRRTIERVLDLPGFRGEVVVFENVHFRLPDGSGLARAWTHPSDRNVDVPGWNKMGDLIPHFASQSQGAANVSFVGLIDGGASQLAGDPWHDPEHAHGVYGGDGRGPIAPGDGRDGYHWDFTNAFRLKRSMVDYAQTPLTWPRFTSPKSGLVIDLRDGVFERDATGALRPSSRELVWINMTTCNEHASTGFTGACKSPMGVVDMSAGRMGTDPRVRDYSAVHYFGQPGATWRMAGPLAQFGQKVRSPTLYLTVAEWVSVTPAGGWDPEQADIRLAEASAVRTRAVVAGTDPVAIDTWCVRNLIMPNAGGNKAMVDLDSTDAKVVKFLRYFREVYGRGTMDLSMVDVA